MLRSLSIRNYALIDAVEINLDKGLTIITGETGAGKSILLGALGLLLGDRADSAALSDKSKKCFVEGTFDIRAYALKDFFSVNDLDYSDSSVIRREITPEGKSRAFINDTPVNVSVLKAIGERLVDVHSQHETLTLNESRFQLAIVDVVAGANGLLDDYQEFFRNYKKLTNTFAELTEKENKSRKDLDYFRFQFEELEAAGLKTGEQTSLETEAETIEHAETIKSGLSRSAYALDGAEENLVAGIAEVKNTLAQLARFNPQIKQLADRLASSHIELKDIARELDLLEGTIIHDPKRAEVVQERLDLIYRLQQKHAVKTVEELIDVRNQLEDKIGEIGSLEEQIRTIEKELGEIRSRLLDLGGKLTKKRSAAAPKLSKEIKEMLDELGMPHAELKVQLEGYPEPRENGFDKITFLFTANKGGTLLPLNKVASGGELSRLMLSLKSLLARHTSLPTIIFDEIDSGISGDVGARMGTILGQMADRLQVIAITHLPQVASRGKSHLFVYKEESGKRSVTRIKSLSKDERVNEIAKMLSAGKVGEAALKNAKEMLAVK
ncbi:MAG TPA: DNA repair protein RecN [Bacteroidia bacterium]|nr:DNA repair protein RecN [Bacteroidia bacterium]